MATRAVAYGNDCDDSEFSGWYEHLMHLENLDG